MSSPSRSWLPRLDGLDGLAGLAVIMQIAAETCIFSALLLTSIGPYRYQAADWR